MVSKCWPLYLTLDCLLLALSSYQFYTLPLGGHWQLYSYCC
jgi:hypothetical protein